MYNVCECVYLKCVNVYVYLVECLDNLFYLLHFSQSVVILKHLSKWPKVKVNMRNDIHI